MNPISPMQLRDYVLLGLHLQANTEFDGSKNKPYEGQIGINFDFKKQELEPVFRIDLQVDINSSEEAFKRAPYRIRIALQAFVEFDKSISEDKISTLLGPNGLAMTYAIARGIVGQATGTSLHGKFLLPTVNFIELLEKKYSSQAVVQKKRKKGK